MTGRPSNHVNRFLEASAILLTVFDVLVWFNVLAYDVPAPPVQERAVVHVSAPVVVQETIGIPVRVVIPSIALDAAVEKVALTEDGSMDVPKDPLDVAWYALGPRPGEKGSATIAGHVDWWHGETAVFADLHKVRPGDRIVVRDDTGAALSFVVRESRTYEASADALDVFTSNDGKAHLNIITCDGTWDKRANQYSKRLVVFTDKEGE
jgi:sortase A